MMVTFSFAKRELVVVAILLAVSFIVRLLLFPTQGYQIDTNDFISWFNTAAIQGIRPFYTATWADYPPFNVYIFWFFGSLANATPSINVINFVKLAPNIFDLATGAVIFFFIRKQTSLKLALAATALYVFNPAVIFNAAVWGQFDAIYTFFLVLSLVLALKAKPELSAVSLAIALLTKPQAIALAPLIAYLIYQKSGLKRTLISTATFAATILIIVLPFQWNGEPFSSLSQVYFGGFGYYSVTSVNAFNLWGLYALWASDAGFFIVGWTLFIAFSVFIFYFLHKRSKINGETIAIFCAFMFFFSFFMLPTRIHERYLFPAISVLAMLFPLVKRTRPFYIVLTGTLLANEAYILYWLRTSYPNATPNLTGDPIVLAVSAINLFMLLYASVLMLGELKGRNWLTALTTKSKPNEQEGKQT